MNSFPFFSLHNAVECFNSSPSIPGGRESSYAFGSGGFAVDCAGCDLRTFSDLTPNRRRAGVAAAILVAAVLVGCTDAPPAKTMEETFADIRHHQAEIHLFGDLARCLHPGLNEVQKEYLLSGNRNGTLNYYQMQHYVTALATTAKEADCQLLAVRICERVSPGECIAPPDEKPEQSRQP